MLRSVSDLKFEHLTPHYVLWIIYESIHELSMFRWLGSVRLLHLLTQLLEFEALKIDFFEALHL